MITCRVGMRLDSTLPENGISDTLAKQPQNQSTMKTKITLVFAVLGTGIFLAFNVIQQTTPWVVPEKNAQQVKYCTPNIVAIAMAKRASVMDPKQPT
jgi:hypothetical protein